MRGLARWSSDKGSRRNVCTGEAKPVGMPHGEDEREQVASPTVGTLELP